MAVVMNTEDPKIAQKSPCTTAYIIRKGAAIIEQAKPIPWLMLLAISSLSVWFRSGFIVKIISVITNNTIKVVHKPERKPDPYSDINYGA
jgi:hypothetical protein